MLWTFLYPLIVLMKFNRFLTVLASKLRWKESPFLSSVDFKLITLSQLYTETSWAEASGQQSTTYFQLKFIL